LDAKKDLAVEAVLLINKDGNVSNINLSKKINDEFDNSIKNQILTIVKFDPATLNDGKIVKCLF
jgi:hypothetical protein